jgi:hypothetical protein
LIKPFAAAMLLVILVASGQVGADVSAKPASRPTSGKALPFAPPPLPMPEVVAACAADVKPCPDGSTVSRNPANDCTFDACPGESKH